MQRLILGKYFSIAALVAGAAAALACAAGQWFESSRSWHVGLALAGLALPAVLSAPFLCRQVRQARAARRALLQWSRDGFGESTAVLSNQPALLPADNPWRTVVEQAHASLAEIRGRMLDAEHARAALEVRARRSAQEARRAADILHSLSDPLLVVNERDELVLASDGAERLFDLSVGDAEPRPLAQLVRCEKLVELITQTRQRQVATQRSDELSFSDDEGASRWYSATVSRLTGAATEAANGPAGGHGAVAVLHDVSEQKAIHKRNAEFVSAVSHEMKTPLAGIKAYVEMLLDGDAPDEETREEFLNVIDGQADRLRRLIDNMLNLSRIEAGVASIDKQPLSLNEILEESLNVVRPAAEAKSLELEAHLSSMYLGVLADRDQLQQATINLLSNAVKYTHSGGRVVLRSRLDGENVQFEVQDTGVGLSDEDRTKVFERFYRVRTNSQMASGTGLGLPLAKHIVEQMHGGRLTVESTLGSGSTFRVTLPLAAQMS